MSSDDLVYHASVNEGVQMRAGGRIWWSNAGFFVSFHFIGLAALWNWPKSWREWVLLYTNWQIAILGITMGMHESLRRSDIPGYHRLWSHRSFTARLPLRILLAIMGTMGFQGSIRYLLVLSDII